MSWIFTNLNCTKAVIATFMKHEWRASLLTSNFPLFWVPLSEIIVWKATDVIMVVWGVRIIYVQIWKWVVTLSPWSCVGQVVNAYTLNLFEGPSSKPCLFGEMIHIIAIPLPWVRHWLYMSQCSPLLGDLYLEHTWFNDNPNQIYDLKNMIHLLNVEHWIVIV